MILCRELLDAGDQVVHERNARDLVHGRVDRVPHIVVGGGVVDELLEGGGGDAGVLRVSGEVAASDCLNGPS